MGAVESFYGLIANRQFDQAGELWSQHMIDTWGIQSGIVQRFAATTQLTLRDARLLSQTNDRAAVHVDLLEWTGTSPNPREWIGTWYLVWGGTGWLLDQANF